MLMEAVPQHPKRRTRGLRTPWATGLLHDAIWRCARLDLGTDREAAICDRAIPGVVIVAVADKRAAVFVQDFLNVGRKVAHAALGGAMLSELWAVSSITTSLGSPSIRSKIMPGNLARRASTVSRTSDSPSRAIRGASSRSLPGAPSYAKRKRGNAADVSVATRDQGASVRLPEALEADLSNICPRRVCVPLSYPYASG